MRTVYAGNCLRIQLLFLLACVAPRFAAAHGFRLALVDGQLVGQSENVPVLESRLFVSTMFAAGQALASEHGSVEASGSSGLNLASDTFSMQLEGRLWYSGGGQAVPAGGGSVLTGTNLYNTADQFKVDGNGVDPQFHGFAITGGDAHEVFSSLSGSPIAAGAYGFSYRVAGLAGGDPETAYETSDLLVVVMNTPGFSSDAAALAIYAAATAVPGDFNLDGAVDGADFVIWQTNFPTQSGAELSAGDANGDGAVDGADFVIWQTNFPTVASGTTAVVPEPRGAWLLAVGVGLAVMVSLQRRRRQAKAN